MTFWFLSLLVGICLATSLLPFVPHPHGVFRVWEFPRTQILFTSVISALGVFMALPWGLWGQILFAAALLSIIIQLVHIARFTPFWRRRSADYKNEPPNAPMVQLLISNVKMGNREYQHTIDLLNEEDPDIAVFMETDQKWIDALTPATENFSYKIECPIDNGYGIFLVSKFRLFNDQIRYLLNPEVPSIDAMVTHPSGDVFRLFVVHPEPPLATNDTMARDAEISFVGKLIRHDEHPVVVTGDLNDVAWSRTTRRFLRLSRLLDPREGRGQFNTFDARYPLLRWPLDHIFHSPHFKLVSMARMPHIKSDHFPMYYKLALTQANVGRRRVDSATENDLEEADELIAVEKDRDNRPVGHDWETG